MSDELNLCMGCMNELDRLGNCTHCGYVKGTPHIKPYLAPETVLDDRYLVGKLLSYNGEGASYIGYDMVTNEKIVVREYLPDTLCTRTNGSDEVIVNYDCLAKYKTFMSEFAEVNRVLSKMRSMQHIVPAKDMFTQNNTTYAILEYVEGVSLKKFLQSNRGQLSWEQVKKLFPPIFTTLSLVHNAGIIHRGISPENIIVTTRGELRMIGFCISSIRTCNTELSPELYPGYAAPEQYNTLEYQGTWTDVYAIAAVLYRILTGCVPAEAYSRIGNDTLIEPRRINPEVPVPVSNVIMKAMDVRCERRLQTVTELVTQLFEQPAYVDHHKGATQTIPIQKPIPTAPRRKPPVKKKNNVMSMTIGIVTVVVLIGLVAFLLILIFGPDSKEKTTTDTTQKTSVSTTTAPRTTTAETTTSEEEDDIISIMPDLTGKYYPSVESTISTDFTITQAYEYSDEYDNDMIISQSIAIGTEYHPSEKPELTLTISLGPEEVTVPEFAGLSQKQYLSKLDELKIRYTVIPVYSSSVSLGVVTKTSIAPGEKINVKTPETLEVSVSANVEDAQGVDTTTTTKKPD